MTHLPSSEKIQVRIRSAEDLFNAIRDPRIEVQLPTLRAVMDDPQRALKLGRHEGQDVIDVLSELTRTDPNGFLHQARLMALACYREPRAHTALLQEFHRNPDGQLAMFLANRLAMEPLELTRPVLRPLLTGVSGPAATGAALVLQRDDSLSVAERLRVATLLGEVALLPAFQAASWREWAAEAAAAQGQLVREALRTNPAALQEIVANFQELPPALQRWLIALPEIPVEQVQVWALNASDRLLLRSVVRRIVAADGIVAVEVARAWLRCPDPEVQAGAVHLGAADFALEPWLEPAQPSPVRLAALRRLALRGFEVLFAWLDDHDWQMRALATELLVQAGPACLPGLRERALRPAPEPGRAAAVQALLQLGEADWLEENLLAPILARSSE